MGTLNLGEGTVACLQVRREKGFWGTGPEGLGWKEKCLHKEGWYVEVDRGVSQCLFAKMDCGWAALSSNACWHELFLLPVFSKLTDGGACTARVPAAPRGRGCPFCVPCDSCPAPGVLPTYNQNQLLPPHPSQLHPRLLHSHW